MNSKSIHCPQAMQIKQQTNTTGAPIVVKLRHQIEHVLNNALVRISDLALQYLQSQG